MLRFHMKKTVKKIEVSRYERPKKNKLISEELSIINKIYNTTRFGINFFLKRANWFGPGFFIYNVKSKDAIKSNFSKMLEWIEDNGDWL